MNIQSNIDDFITKYLCGEAMPEEAIQLEDWKAEADENMEYFQEMSKAFNLVNDLPNTTIKVDSSWERFKNNRERKTRYWVYIAIAVLIISGILNVVFQDGKKEGSTEIIAKNMVIQQSLPDQTKVELEKHSMINFEEGFGKSHRKLTFSGKAEFHVYHDKNLPFIIETNAIYLEDLGTIFTVENRPESDTLYLIVKEGIVRIYDDLGNEIIVKAGEKAWYIKSAKQIITDAESKVIKFNFKDTKLAEVISLIKEAYDVDIVLSPSKIGDCKITTQFFDEDLATIITIITKTLGFKYQYQSHRFIIQGKPCQ